MLSGACFWILLKRSDLVESPPLRLAAVGLLLSGYGTSFAMRTGRMDSLFVALSLAISLTFTIKRTVARRGLIVLLGAMLAVTGLQVTMYVVVMCGLVLVFTRRSLKDMIVLGAGWVLGFGALIGIYQSHGVWGAFVQTALNTPRPKLNLLWAYVEDFSSIPLLLVSLILVGHAAWRKERVPRPLLFGLAAMVLLPFLFSRAGKYPIYYTWMAFLPALAGVFCALDKLLLKKDFERAFKLACAVLLGAAALIGLPARLAVAAHRAARATGCRRSSGCPRDWLSPLFAGRIETTLLCSSWSMKRSPLRIGSTPTGAPTML